jgi:Pilus formation protein N terminal region
MTPSLLLVLALAAEPLRLAPGTQEVMRVGAVTRIAVADPSVADVVSTGKGELLVLGKQLGRTTITLWPTSGGTQTRQVVVDDGKGIELAGKVRELVSPTLKVDQFNGLTVIDGTLDSVDEWRRLKTLVEGDASVKLLVRMNPRVLPLIAVQMNAAFKKQGLTQARAECVGQTIFLEGSVADDKELHKALVIANAYYGAATSSLTLQ